MGFLAPWFLGGLAALGVPVFVHLLRRHKATPRPVSSLMFFERGTQSSTRHRRLRYLVLFALRCALVLLVVLAFANPYIWKATADASTTSSTDRKSTRLNSSHGYISYAVFCLKKKNTTI